jgi:hypothetical protein
MSSMSAGHGMSYPLQHNLGDDTAYSMMHVPIVPQATPAQQPAPKPQYSMPAGPGLPGQGSPLQNAAAPHGYAPPGYIPQGYMPLYYPLAPPPSVPHPPAVTEQRLRELIEMVVASMLAREKGEVAQRSDAAMREIVRAAEASLAGAPSATAATPAAASAGISTAAVVVIVGVALLLLILFMIGMLLLLLKFGGQPTTTSMSPPPRTARSGRRGTRAAPTAAEPEDGWLMGAVREVGSA